MCFPIISAFQYLKGMLVQQLYGCINILCLLSQGNGTMEKLHDIFTLSGQKFGGLMLDLHRNRFGPTALFQVSNYFNFLRVAV